MKLGQAKKDEVRTVNSVLIFVPRLEIETATLR